MRRARAGSPCDQGDDLTLHRQCLDAQHHLRHVDLLPTRVEPVVALGVATAMEIEVYAPVVGGVSESLALQALHLVVEEPATLEHREAQGTLAFRQAGGETRERAAGAERAADQVVVL